MAGRARDKAMNLLERRGSPGRSQKKPFREQLVGGLMKGAAGHER